MLSDIPGQASLTIEEFHTELLHLRHRLADRGLWPTINVELNLWSFHTESEAETRTYELRIIASETQHAYSDDQWKRTFTTDFTTGDEQHALREAIAWIDGLPSTEERAREECIRQINNLVAKLPKESGNHLADGIYQQLGKLLHDEANRIAHNALTYQPAPERKKPDWN